MNFYADYIRNQLSSVIENIEHQSEKFVKNPGHDFTRNRKMNFISTINFLLTMEGGSIGAELHKYFNYDLNHITRSGFICQRNKLHPNAMEHLFHEFHKKISCSKTYQDYQLLACDGSDLNIFRDSKNSSTHFVGKEGSFGFNQLHLNALYDLLNRRYVDALIQEPYEENESTALVEMVKRLPANQPTIVMADRGYETYNIFANIQERGLFYLIRIKDSSKKGSISGSLSLPVNDEFDEEVELIMTRKQKYFKVAGYKYLAKSSPFDFLDSEQHFYKLRIRITQFQLENGVYECIASNLDKNNFPAEKIKELYHLRWGIETSFRKLKYTIGLTHLHSKKVEYICQEIYAKLVMYNFCEIISSHVVLEQRNRKYIYQLNYTMAVHICRYYLRQKYPAVDVEGLIRKEISPQRPHRQYQRRVIKKRWVSFAYRMG